MNAKKAQIIEELKAYASENYEAGAHWVVECFGDEDYENFVEPTLRASKRALKGYWELMVAREKDCAW